MRNFTCKVRKTKRVKWSKKRAENNEKKREKDGANSSKEGCKKMKEEAENNGKRGQPTEGKVGCKKLKKWGSQQGEGWLQKFEEQRAAKSEESRQKSKRNEDVKRGRINEKKIEEEK